MKEESHPLESGWLEEIGKIFGEDNMYEAAILDKSEEDRPLSFHSQVDAARVERLRLPSARTKPLLLVRNAIVTDAILAHEAGKAVSYSRNNNFYAREVRYRGLPFTRGNIFATIELLREQGLIKEERARPGDHLRTQQQSRFWATPRLVELWGNDEATFTYDPHELIRRKNVDGDLIDYNDSNRTRRWRNDLREYVEALNATDIVLDAPDVAWRSAMVRVSTEDGDEVIIQPFRKAGYRVFNDGWNLGGRFYGPFFQGLPSERRAQLLMNGNPVVEHDHSQLHARLLYAEFGLEVDGDAYTIQGHEHRRNLFKIAWQIMINASSRRQGMYALATKLAEEALRRDGWTKSQAKKRAPDIARKFLRNASDILSLLEERHAAVKDAFYTGAGLRLQRTDSDMCMAVNRKALKEGIVAGSVHDSHFTEQGRNADRVKELMDDQLHMVIGRATQVLTGHQSQFDRGLGTDSANHCPVTVSAPPVLQMVEGCAPAPALLLDPDLGLPARPSDLSGILAVSENPRAALLSLVILDNDIQGDLLPFMDSPGSAVFRRELPASVSGYTGGILPLEIRRAIQDRKRALVMTQEEVAAQIGLSRPQLANALQGRCGLSPMAGSRLVQWLRSPSRPDRSMRKAA
jgi:hypothetical protein